MRSHGMLIPALIVASLPIAGAFAQTTTAAEAAAQAQEQAQEQARQNAITDRYLTAVPVEMASKIDTKNAAVGQEVTVRTQQDARLADGTDLPRGTKLFGHVIQVKPGGQELGSAVLTLNFDRAEVKSGESMNVRAVIRAVAPNAVIATASQPMMAQPPMDVPYGGGVNTTGRGSGRGGVAGGMPGTTVPSLGGGNVGGVGGGVGGYPGSTNPQVGMPDGTGTTGGGTVGSTEPSVGDSGPVIGGRTSNIGSLGGGPMNVPTNRKVSDAGESVSGAPKATGLPGVMLWASPTASGTLTASGRNFSLDSGMQITMGVIRR
jgi:hypothetical protein